MPSFDVVSEVDIQEVKNALDQARREIETRYDFRNSKASVELQENVIIVIADDTLRLEALNELLKQKLAKRKVSLKSVEFKEAKKAGGDMLREEVEVKNGLTQDELKRLNKMVKDQKFKVTCQIQETQLRVTGKKRDDLQEVIAYLKESAADLDLQFGNFRD